MLYNQEDSRRALRDLIGTGMYENVQVLPEQTKKDERKVDVTVMVKERPMNTTEAGTSGLGLVFGFLSFPNVLLELCLTAAVVSCCFTSLFGTCNRL